MALAPVGSARWAKVNEALAQRLGWTPEEVASMELIDRRQPDRVRSADGSYVCIDWSIEAQDGVECWIGRERKAPMVRELHHRLKNVLQFAVSLLAFQSGQLEEAAGRAQLALAESRVRALSRLFEPKYSSADFSQIEFGAYLRNLVNTMVSGGERVSLEIGEAVIPMHVAIPLGIICHEFLASAATELPADSQIRVSFHAADSPDVDFSVSGESPLFVRDEISRDLLELMVEQLKCTWTNGENLSVKCRLSEY